MYKNQPARIQWLDCAKFAAIFAVITDHMQGILYLDLQIAFASYYSTSLFILISGYSLYKSAEKRPKNGYSGIWRQITRILYPYALSVFIIQILTTGSFNLRIYLDFFLNFNIAGAHYYVLLYIQLLLAAPVLLGLLRKKKHTYTLGGAVSVVIISIFTTNRTNILGVYGGGGVLFGGTYLILFYIGMLFAYYDVFRDRTKIQYIVATVFFAIAWWIWWIIIYRYFAQINRLVPFGSGFNPPSISFMVFSILTMFLVHSSCGTLKSLDIRAGRIILNFTSYLGQHTLYIFLYHTLVQNHLRSYLNIENLHIKRIAFMTAVFAIPIFIEWLVTIAQKFLNSLLYPAS